MEQLVEKLKELWCRIKKVFKNIWINVKKVIFKIYSYNTEFRELLTSYNRTTKKRVKKKYYNKMIRFIINQPIRG